MSTITRRQTLTGTAAIAAAAVLPSMPAQATAEPVNEPLLDMAREWWALRDYSENHPDQSDKVQDPIHEQLSAMERVIYLTPARTIQGVLVKSRINNIAAFTEESFFGNLDDILSVDPAKFTCFDKMAPIAIYQDLQRLAGRAVS